MVAGFDAAVVKLPGREHTFSLLLKSLILSVRGSIALNAVAVALVVSVAVNVEFPIDTFIALLLGGAGCSAIGGAGLSSFCAILIGVQDVSIKRDKTDIISFIGRYLI